jgi:signal transduction histidine kinase
MSSFSLEELKHYIGFDEQDAANLHALAPYVRPLLPAAIDRFYDEIDKHIGTRVLMTGGPPQATRLRATLSLWLEQLFCGTYDSDYWQSRESIGEAHVRIGLPQQYMLAAMQVIWAELERGVHALGLPNVSAKLSSLHKLLTLELAVMLDSYKEHYSEQIRGVEREAVQERLTEAEHLAQIGHLAASLAHEIKNPLAGISGAIQVIRDSMKPTEPHRPILDEILRQIGRLDNTVKDLLIFARPKPPRFRKCNIQDVIAEALPVWRQQPEIQRVHFEYVNSRALPPIAADENQVEQLLTNLLLNAAQASKPGGLVRLTSTPQPDGIRLSIEDRGHGMDQEVRRRAVEPFFTTKARGTGLGLSICKKIVETHGGALTIKSVVGEGTEVIVDLPRRQPSAEGEVG